MIKLIFFSFLNFFQRRIQLVGGIQSKSTTKSSSSEVKQQVNVRNPINRDFFLTKKKTNLEPNRVVSFSDSAQVYKLIGKYEKNYGAECDLGALLKKCFFFS